MRSPRSKVTDATPALTLQAFRRHRRRCEIASALDRAREIVRDARAAQVRAVQQQQELIVGIAPDQIVGARGAAADDDRDPAQRIVAGGVAVRVIERAETDRSSTKIAATTVWLSRGRPRYVASEPRIERRTVRGFRSNRLRPDGCRFRARSPRGGATDREREQHRAEPRSGNRRIAQRTGERTRQQRQAIADRRQWRFPR